MAGFGGAYSGDNEGLGVLCNTGEVPRSGYLSVEKDFGIFKRAPLGAIQRHKWVAPDGASNVIVNLLGYRWVAAMRHKRGCCRSA